MGAHPAAIARRRAVLIPYAGLRGFSLAQTGVLATPRTVLRDRLLFGGHFLAGGVTPDSMVGEL